MIQDALRLELDAAGSVPLYRQIAEALRYRIARGALAPRTRLPGLREAAAMWGVNLHTVRRGYQELERARLVDIRRPGGTFVAPGAVDAARDEARAFARRVLDDGKRLLGLDGTAVAALIARAASPPRAERVQVAECSRQLSGALAGQIAASLGIATQPILVKELERTASGPVVATWFHYTEVRAKLPNRADLHFVAVEPHLPHRAAIVTRAVQMGGLVILAERDALLAPAIATDVRRLLHDDRVRVEPDARTAPSVLVRRRRGVVVCSPASWELLSAAERKRPHVVLLEYRLSDSGLADLATALGVATPTG